MPGKREKVVVAMSGGVDSSVAACLLVEQGYEVLGLFMRHGATAPATASEPQTSACASDAGSAQGEEVCVNLRGESDSESPRGLKPAARVGVGAGTEPRGGVPHSPGGDRAHSVVDAAAAPLPAASRPHQGCCSANDAADARFVAGLLGIPFYALNFEHDFDELIDYFADEYARGRTPNPCVVCNDRLKFGRVVEYADAVGARYIATGHYARVERRDGRGELFRACDRRKDQSYVLFGLSRAVLDRAMFPIGAMEKRDVRALAARYDLPNRDKPDSVDICFVPDRDYARVVRERRPDAFVPGEVVDGTGRVLGRHEGIGHYTIGQRRGLGIAAGRPVYVTDLNVTDNRVTLGDGEALRSAGLIAERVNYLADAPTGPFCAAAQIRYQHAAAAALVHPLDGGRIRVMFDEPQKAVTPGQAVVLYEGDRVLGGGWIAAPCSA